MRVLWLCNIMVPQLQNLFGLKEVSAGGWMVDTFEQLSLRKGIQIAYCAPLEGRKKTVKKAYKSAICYGFPQKKKQAHQYDKTLEKIFRTILEDFQPEIVHIFGTEYPHALAMAKAFHNPMKTIVHMQGIISTYGQLYQAFLPARVYYRMTFRDLIRLDNILLQKKKFDRRGIYERKTLMNVGHVMGRTEFDYAAVKNINPKIVYHTCPENLRKEFSQSEDRWSIRFCEEHSIFMAQGPYPIKGLHLALEALREIIRFYPDTILYVAGPNVLFHPTWKNRVKISSYTKYILKLLSKWNLKENVKFLGELNAQQMKKQYLKSHVYILPSVIENSPNSLYEAMSLGIPSVAAAVGGVSSMLEHNKEGYLYQAQVPYMLAHYILKIFEDPNLAEKISKNAFHRLKKLKRTDQNLERLLEIYRQMK